MNHEGWGDLESRSDVAVVDADDPDVVKEPALAVLERRGLLVPGTMLVQNPYRTDAYEPFDEGAADQFAVEKFAIFAQLCQYLGAKSVTASAVENVETGEKVALTGGGGAGPVAAEVEGERTTLQKFAAQLDLGDRYSGGAVNVAAAHELLREHGLDGDVLLWSLVKSRSYEANTHKERKLLVDLSSESSRTFEAAAKLKVPAYLQVDLGVKRTQTQQAKYRVTYEVKF